MNKHIYLLFLWLLALLPALPSQAQYITANTNGVIGAGEYGNSANQYQTATGGTWYMTWDADNLYVAKTGGSNAEPAIMYIDLDPYLPVTGGTVAKGLLTGTYDNGVTPVLPFRGDVRVKFTSSTLEVQRSDGNGSWASLSSSNVALASGAGVREIRLSWATLTGGGTIPPSFNWLGYASSIAVDGSGNPIGANAYRYDQAPITNGAAGTNGGASPHLDYYYTIINTANNVATKPFDLRSYTFLDSNDNNAFGAIDVWDFTMNATGRQISRGTTQGNWNIGGSLVVGGGTVYFGNSSNSNDFGTTTVSNVRVTGGRLDMDQSPKVMTVRESVNLTGGQFRLSGTQGGDLVVGRDFIVMNGSNAQATFQGSGRAVTFTGAGVTHQVQANNNYQIPFDFLSVNSPSGSVNLGSTILVQRTINFFDGNIQTNNYFVQLDQGANLGTETANSHILGQARITQYMGIGRTGTPSFGGIGLQLTPQNDSEALGYTTIVRTTGTSVYTGGNSGGGSITRYFTVTGENASSTKLDITLTFAYRTDELNGFSEPKLALFQSTNGTTYTRITTPPSANTTNHTVMTSTNLSQIVAGTFFTLGDGTVPLPVKLVAFTAKATSEGAAILRWNTASESGSKGFGIERQLGAGEPWKSVGYVASNNSATGGSYEFLDKSLVVAPASAQAYYRLRQEDFNGTLSYSPVEVIARTRATDATELVLSPVPVSGSALSLTFAEAGQAGSQVTVSNTQGQRMLNFTTAASSEVALSLPVEKLAPGVYIVSVQVPGQSPRYARFVKQ